MIRAGSVALILVVVLTVTVPAAAQGSAGTGEPVRQLLAEMDGSLQEALAQARDRQTDAAVAGIQAYLAALRRLDELLPSPPDSRGGETRDAALADLFAGIRAALERQGAILAATIHALPPEARSQVLEMVGAEFQAGYRHPTLAAIIRRALGQAARTLRRQELERLLAQARTRLARAVENAARLEQRARQMEARLGGIADPAREELAARRVRLAWLEHEIALKQVERLTLYIAILEEELARLNGASGAAP